jgi:hypothetical protein
MKMWEFEEFSNSILRVARWGFGLFAIDIAVMIYVLVRTCKYSKLSHVYIVAILMLIYPIFGLLTSIFENWIFGCSPTSAGGNFHLNEDKCPFRTTTLPLPHGKTKTIIIPPSLDWYKNLGLAFSVCIAVC